jgi:hypothetical protein
MSTISFIVQDLNIGFPYGQPIAPWTGPNGPDASCFLENLLSYQATDESNDIVNYGFSTEPQLAVNPTNPANLIAIWQINRLLYYGSQEAGIAYTFDGGRTWNRTTIPVNQCKGGYAQRPDDVWVTFTREGRAVVSHMYSMSAFNPTTYYQSGIASAYSDDGGKTWTHYIAAYSPQYQNDPNQDITSTIAANIPPFTGPFCVPCPIPGPTPSSCTFPPCTPNPYGFNPAISGAYDDKDMVLADPNDPRFVYLAWHRYPTSSFSPYHSDSVCVISVDGGKTFGNIQQLYDPFPDLFEHHQSNGLYWNTTVSDDILGVLPRWNKCSKKYRNDPYPNKKQRFSGDVLDIIARSYALPGVSSVDYESNSFPHSLQGQDLVLVRSPNKGRTWTKNALVITEYPSAPVYSGGYTYDANGNLTGHCGIHLRSGGTHNFKVNPENGFCYLVYQTRSSLPNKLPTIFLRSSRDGGYTWSDPIIVSSNTLNAKNPQAFCPTVAIGKNGRVGVTFHDTRFDPYQVGTPSNPQPCNPPSTSTLGDAWFVLYRETADASSGNTGIGLDRISEVRVTTTSYNLQQGASTYDGFMVQGEYNGLVAAGSVFTFLYIKSLTNVMLPIQNIYGPDAYLNLLQLKDNGQLSTSPFISVIQT